MQSLKFRPRCYAARLFVRQLLRDIDRELDSLETWEVVGLMFLSFVSIAVVQFVRSLW